MNFKTKYIIFLVLFLSTILVCFTVFKTVLNKSENFKAMVYEINNGYGYSISYNDKLLIKQDFIPAIQNNQAFCNFDDAQKVADLVKEKLKRKENPKISLIELKQLNIQLICPD